MRRSFVGAFQQDPELIATDSGDDTPEDVMSRADAEMYRRKAAA